MSERSWTWRAYSNSRGPALHLFCACVKFQWLDDHIISCDLV